MRPSFAPTFVFALILCSTLFLPEIILSHHDLGWHIASGDLIRTQGAVPIADPWSFTAGNYRWFDLSWAWDLIVSTLHQLFGLSGVLIFASILVALIPTTVVWICVANAVRPSIAVSISCVALYCATAYELPDTPISASPQTATILFSVLLYAVLYIHSRTGNARALLFIPPLFLVWVNVHGGFTITALIAGAFIVDGVVNHRRNHTRQIFFILVSMLPILLLTPYGWRIFFAIFDATTHSSHQFTTEWMPFHLWPLAIPSGFLTTCVLLIIFNARKVAVADLVICGTLLLSGLVTRRHLALFFIFVTIPVARILKDIFDKIRHKVENHNFALAEQSNHVQPVPTALVILVLALISPVMLRVFMPEGPHLLKSIYPTAAIDYLKLHFPDKRVFNDWNLGSAIIFQTRGEVKVFIDGRAGTAYPPSLFADLEKDYFSRQNWQGLFDKYQIEVAIFPSYRKIALAFFDQSSEWTRVYSDEHAIIYKRGIYKRERGMTDASPG